MVFLNKMVLSGNFPYPLFLTWAQLVIALALCWIGGKLGEQYVILPFCSPHGANDSVELEIFTVLKFYSGYSSLARRTDDLQVTQACGSMTIITNHSKTI